jgi:dihydropteroate synthase type 2
MEILGILNITADSFSDGGRYLDQTAALQQADQLVADGAAIVDVGAESTHPAAADVPTEVELARLRPVVKALLEIGLRVSVDTAKAAVMREMVALGVEWINDVNGLRDPEARAVLADSDTQLILMHTTGPTARAAPTEIPPAEIVGHALQFFERQLAAAEAAGISRERIVLDPGMGFFLGRDPEVSCRVLRELDTLRSLGRPLCVSTSRKSFIGSILGTIEQSRPTAERAAGTLASELWAAVAGVEFIRTHEPRPLHDAWTVWRAIAQAD